MSNAMKPYPEYKDSGVPWLGKIPAHWDVRRNGRLFAQRNETGFGDLPILEVSLRTGVRVRDMDNLKRKQVMSDAEKYKRAAKGDIAYNMMRMWQGALGTAPVDGLVSPAYVVARPFEETNPQYFSYLFRTDAYMNEVDGYSRGIVKDRNRLYWQDFKRMPSCFPPPEEQAAIVRFLDANAVLVRQFIRNRRRLIEVLTEQKQAIINRAVTRGLDPNVKLKPSGVDWLGDVPEDWSINRFKSVVQIRSGQVDPTNGEYSRYTLIAPDHIEKGTGKILALETAANQNAISGKYYVQRGEVIYSKIRPALRKAVIAPSDCLCSADMYPLKPNHDLLPEYLLVLLLLPSTTRYLVDSSMRVAMPKVNRDTLGTLPLWYPNKKIQQAILSDIHRRTEPIETAIQTALNEISLITEYHRRLIADVASGSLDVRSLSTQIHDILGDVQESEDDNNWTDDEDLDDEVSDADE